MNPRGSFEDRGGRTLRLRAAPAHTEGSTGLGRRRFARWRKAAVVLPEPPMVVEPNEKAPDAGRTAPIPLSLRVFDCPVTIQCEDVEARALLVANYGYLQHPQPGEPFRVQYRVRRLDASRVRPPLASLDRAKPLSWQPRRGRSSLCSRRI